MSDHWGTPPVVFDAIMAGCGEAASKWHDPCPYKGELTSNGLSEYWESKTFVNPPFSDPAPWIRRAHHYAQIGHQIVMVLPAFTDRKWFIKELQPLLLRRPSVHQIVHIGRVNYIPLEGQKKSSPRFGSCLVSFNILDFADNVQKNYLGL